MCSLLKVAIIALVVILMGFPHDIYSYFEGGVSRETT